MEREFYQKTQLILLLISVVFISSCNKEVAKLDECVLPGEEIASSQEESGSDTDQDDSSAAPKVCLLPEREPAANLEINYVLNKFPEDREAKMERSIERLMIIVNSVEFRERVLNHEYEGKKTFVDNEGLTNEEIYIKLMEGAEKLSPEVDEEIDLDITLYYRNNSTVGYTYPNVEKIWVNDKFFSKNSYGKVSANLIHEWLHKLGFGHDKSPTARRAYSVPYGIGTIVKELVDGMTPSAL